MTAFSNPSRARARRRLASTATAPSVVGRFWTAWAGLTVDRQGSASEPMAGVGVVGGEVDVFVVVLASMAHRGATMASNSRVDCVENRCCRVGAGAGGEDCHSPAWADGRTARIVGAVGSDGCRDADMPRSDVRCWKVALRWRYIGIHRHAAVAELAVGTSSRSQAVRNSWLNGEAPRGHKWPCEARWKTEKLPWVLGSRRGYWVAHARWTLGTCPSAVGCAQDSGRWWDCSALERSDACASNN